MDTSFLSNPVNTGIAAITIISVVAGLLWFLSKRNFSAGRDGIQIKGISEKAMIDKIPDIDRSLQNTCNRIVDKETEVFMGFIGLPFTKILSRVVYMVFCQVMYTRIYENHLTRVFSNQDEYIKWVNNIVETIMLQLLYIKNFADEAFDQELFREPLAKAVTHVTKEFTPFIRDSVNKKLICYRDLEQTQKVKELIDKNEEYLRKI
jgi:hypothetical protein